MVPVYLPAKELFTANHDWLDRAKRELLETLTPLAKDEACPNGILVLKVELHGGRIVQAATEFPAHE